MISDKFILSQIFLSHSTPFTDEDEDIITTKNKGGLINPESQGHLNNHAFMFRRITKLIAHMSNLDEEEEKIIKNLDG